MTINPNDKLGKAKKYQRIKHWVTLVSLVTTLLLLVVILKTSLGLAISQSANQLSLDYMRVTHRLTNNYIELLAYFFFFSVIFFVVDFPISFFSGYVIEKKYELSNHTLVSWFTDTMKQQILSFAFMALMVLVLFGIIWHYPNTWWLLTWAAYAAISLVLGQLFPVLIIPIFYKQTPVPDGELRSRITNLGNRFDLNVENIYTLNLSRTTKKANAMFCGMGKTKRAILGDTLVQNFTHDEIEMVLAHELGHYKHNDILKQFFFGLVSSFIIFWVAFSVMRHIAPQFGTMGVADIQLFPNLCLVFLVANLILGPVGNIFSRYVEMKADDFALRAIPAKDVFISSMNKLSDMNLADPNPHPLIEFLLYSHPSIQKRIDFAKAWQS